MTDANHYKKLIWYLVAGILGLTIFFLFYPRMDDFASIQIEMSRDEVKQRVADIAEGLQYDLNNLTIAITLERNNDLLKFAQKKYGLMEVVRQQKKDLPSYYWHVELTRKEADERSSDSTVVAIGSSSEDESSWNKKKDTIIFEIAINGQILSIENNLPQFGDASDSLVNGDLAKIAQQQLLDFSPVNVTDWQLRTHSTEPQRIGVLNRYKWISHQVGWADSLTATIDYHGKKLQRFNLSAGPFTGKKAEAGDDYWYGLMTVIMIMLITILVLISLIQRLRQDKVEFKNAWMVAILSTLAMILISVAQMRFESGREILLYVLFITPLIGVVAFVLSAVSESIARDVWNEKLFSYDRLMRARFLSPRLGRSLLAGLGFAGILLEILVLLILIWDHFGEVWLKYDNNEVGNFVFRLPVLLNFGETWIRTVFVAFAVLFFLISYLRHFLRNNVLWLLACAVLFVAIPFRLFSVYPDYIPMSLNFFVGLILGWAILRFDLIAAWAALITVLSLLFGLPYLHQESSFLISQGVLSLLLPFGFLMIGLFGLRNGEVEDDVAEYVPAYLRRWQERERLQRELEIARNVQLDFLPRAKPEVTWLDVASICIPAYEVGGDYYDFLQLDKDHFGVVVGDVSGKGVSAAFYMTLMKGILKSQSRHVQSAREMLVQINDLFYENAHRGVFISMIYGVFDRRKQTFTFARAGHNPVISHYRQKNQAEQLASKGIAIGLDSGPIFRQALQEVEVPIHAGDVFVFYTDGFSEAMDSDHHEFGEQRLMAMIDQNIQTDATTVLQRIQADVGKFTSATPQHDDMTMVVVRIGKMG